MEMFYRVEGWIIQQSSSVLDLKLRNQLSPQIVHKLNIEVVIHQHLGHCVCFLVQDHILPAVSAKTILCHEHISIYTHSLRHRNQILVQLFLYIPC